MMKKGRKQHPVPPVIHDDEPDDDFVETIKEIFQPKTSNPLSPPITVKKEEVRSSEVKKPVKTESVAAKPNKRIFLEEDTERAVDLDEIDWKRAVVYSEILKRPQYYEG